MHLGQPPGDVKAKPPERSAAAPAGGSGYSPQMMNWEPAGLICARWPYTDALL